MSNSWTHQNHFESIWIHMQKATHTRKHPVLRLSFGLTLVPSSFRLHLKDFKHRLKHYCVCMCVSVCLLLSDNGWWEFSFQWQRGQNVDVCLLFFTFNDDDDNNTLHSISVHSNQLKHLFCLTQRLSLMFFYLFFYSSVSHIHSFIYSLNMFLSHWCSVFELTAHIC